MKVYEYIYCRGFGEHYSVLAKSRKDADKIILAHLQKICDDIKYGCFYTKEEEQRLLDLDYSFIVKEYGVGEIIIHDE